MSESGATAERDEAVAEVLERLRAGVRQRQAELACLDEQRGDRPASLAAVGRDALLEEPSFRIEGAGAFRTFLERAIYVLFVRRHHRALLRQQNRFNRSVELALGELHARQGTLGRELQRLAERLGEASDTDQRVERPDGSMRSISAGSVTGPRSEPGTPAPRDTGRAAGPA